MIDEQTALDALRLDQDFSTSQLVMRYVDTLPTWIETVCGVPADEVRESDDKLLEALEAYLLQLLYCPDGTDSARLQVTVDSLASCVKARQVAKEAQDGTD